MENNIKFSLPSLQEMDDMLATLPIALYLKSRTIKATIDVNAPTSYFNPQKWEIVISFANIAFALQGVKATSKAQLERITRGLLYHEVSHAILSPKEAGHLPEIPCDSWNILEDARIEHLLSSYYLNTDFRELVKAVNGSPTPAQNLNGFLFNVFRHFYIEPKYQSYKAEILQYVKTVLNVEYNFKNPSTYRKIFEWAYTNLERIFNECNPQQQEEEKEEKESSSNSQKSEEEGEKSEEEGKENTEEQEESEEQEETGNESQEEQEESEEQEKGGKNEEENKEEEKGISIEKMIEEASPEEQEESIETAMNRLGTQRLVYRTLDNAVAKQSTIANFVKIITRNKGVGNAKSSASFGYSGKYSAKRALKDQEQTFKWFKKKGLQTKGNQSKKKILNIWLDNSGSFRPNDEATNNILKALEEIENRYKDFTFNLLKFNTEIYHLTGKNRVSQSGGGNALNPEWEKLYKKVNPTSTELNIVLFDGDGTCNQVTAVAYRLQGAYLSPSQAWQHLIPFNNKRTIFICERDNTSSIKKYCPNSLEIIEENNDYTGQLEKNVARALDMLF